MRFNRFGVDLMTLMRPASPATVPVIQQSILAPPASLPAPPSTIVASPAVFPRNATVDELLGAPIRAGTVPASFDPQTQASFVPPAPAPVSMLPTRVPGVAPIAPPAPPVPIFSTISTNADKVAKVATDQANTSALVATISANQAVAAAAAAQQAIADAAFNPTIGTQTKAAAAVETARNTAAVAQDHADTADSHAAQANALVADSHAAADNLQAALDQRAASNAAAVASGDSMTTGNSSDPLVAWDQANPADIIPVIAADGSIVPMMQPKTNWWLWLGIAGAVAGGYYWSKK